MSRAGLYLYSPHRTPSDCDEVIARILEWRCRLDIKLEQTKLYEKLPIVPVVNFRDSGFTSGP
jgi:hypothetical protein